MTESVAGVSGPQPLDDKVMWKPEQRVPKQELDKETFLQLLVAQMRYQDPGSPMDNSQFMQQTSTLGMMEQITNMTTASRQNFMMQQKMAASALNGQTVTWLDNDGGRFSGKVTAVEFTEESAIIKVGDTAIPWDRVTQMTAPGVAPPQDQPAVSEDDTNAATDGAPTPGTAG